MVIGLIGAGFIVTAFVASLRITAVPERCQRIAMAITGNDRRRDESAISRFVYLCLTSSAIKRMIRRMCRRFLAVLLVIGWVSLSGFDLVEDLYEISSQVDFSSASPQDQSKSKLSGWGTLANNVIETANGILQDSGTLVSFTSVIFNVDAFLDFRRHFPLHKLYQVFLI